jgi:hypothetical protein
LKCDMRMPAQLTLNNLQPYAQSVPRDSCHIDRRQARNLMDATYYARTRLVELGRPLNTFVTLNFDHTDCPPEHVSSRFEKLRDNHFVRWLRYRASAPAYYVWAVENSGGDTHVHWVVHVPPSLRESFRTKLPEWLGQVAGTIRFAESAIDVRPVSNLPGLARYLLKGMDSRYAPRYSVRHVPQGLVHGKRCGVSKSLGPAARTRSIPSAQRAVLNPLPHEPAQKSGTVSAVRGPP